MRPSAFVSTLAVVLAVPPAPVAVQAPSAEAFRGGVFTDIFRPLALLFLAMLPLIFLMRSPRAGKDGAAVMH